MLYLGTVEGPTVTQQIVLFKQSVWDAPSLPTGHGIVSWTRMVPRRGLTSWLRVTPQVTDICW